MSSIVQSLTGGGSNNAGFVAKSADLQNATTDAQVGTAYDQTQQGLAQQQNFLAALQAQNGTQNQSNVFNQLQGVANGTGPNPAQAQLAQSTAANTANQTALMAGQRGAGADPGMIARQAAMQGMTNQQNASGQGATLQANQSLGAMGQMGGIAGQQVQNQQTGIQNYNQSAQGQQQNLLSSIQGQNQAAVQNVGQANKTNVDMAKQNGAASQGLLGNVTGALGHVMQIPGIGNLARGVGNWFSAAGTGLAGAGADAIATAGGAADAIGAGATSAGALEGTGELAATAAAAKGGQIQNGQLVSTKGPQSKVGRHFHRTASGSKSPAIVQSKAAVK